MLLKDINAHLIAYVIMNQTWTIIMLALLSIFHLILICSSGRYHRKWPDVGEHRRKYHGHKPSREKYVDIAEEPAGNLEEMQEPSTGEPPDLVNCPSEAAYNPEDCFDIGCTAGSRCQRRELEQYTCCPFIHNEFHITCCSGNVQCKLRAKGCPITQVSSDFKCVEEGCTIGERCKTQGYRSQICCPHTIGEATTSCCLTLVQDIIPISRNKTSGPSSSVKDDNLRCLVRERGVNYECWNVGCVPGSSCKRYNLPDLDCCTYKAGRRYLNCCLKKQEDEESLK